MLGSYCYHLYYDALRVTEDYVTISGFTVKGGIGQGQAGIALRGASHCNVINNITSGNWVGILLHSESSNNTLIDNNASSNSHEGILLYMSSDDNTLIDNIANSNHYYGIRVYKSSGNTLTNNTASSQRDGIYLHSGSDGNILTGNTAWINNPETRR